MVAAVGEATAQISVVLVDDHEVTRQGVRSLVETDPAIRVIGEADDSDEAISLISRLRPDVAVVDVLLRSGSGIEVSKTVASRVPETRILVLSAYDDDRYVRALARVGVSGYLLKSSSAQELKKAIHEVAEGGLVFPSGIAGKVLELLRGEDKACPEEPRVSVKLTGRELEILGYVGGGLKDRQIAESLGISPRTVEVHIRNILRKLGASSRAQAMLEAVRQGWLPDDRR